jgi:hypothetical protein
MMWAALDVSGQEMEELKKHRPDIINARRLERELELEWNNDLLYASKRVLKYFRAFIDEKSIENWRATVKAMKKDLYF